MSSCDRASLGTESRIAGKTLHSWFQEGQTRLVGRWVASVCLFHAHLDLQSKRWLHSLSPTVKKCAWSPEEDAALLSLYNQHGTKWSLIARSIPGRTDDACSKRYREALDPSLKKDEWTPEEDRALLEAYHRIGKSWMKVGQELGRSSLGCRNR